jgi:hypothetical protein
MRALQEWLNFALFAARHDSGSKSGGRLLVVPHSSSRHLLMDCDVVKSAETILQVLEVALKFQSMLRSGRAFEQGFEKFSGETQLLQRDPAIYDADQD